MLVVLDKLDLKTGFWKNFSQVGSSRVNPSDFLVDVVIQDAEVRVRSQHLVDQKFSEVVQLNYIRFYSLKNVNNQAVSNSGQADINSLLELVSDST